MLGSFVRRMSSRVPLIRFRQGGAPEHAAPPPSAAAPQQGQGGKRVTVSATTIEDWQLPARYRRRPISEEECDIINQGGAR